MAWGKHKNGEHRLLLTKQFALGKSMLPTFRPMMLAATRIWNSCVWESRETYKREQRWPTEGELKAKLKTFAAWRELNCQSAQAVVEEYAEAVASYLKHQENGHSEMNKPDFKSHKVLRTVTFKQQRGIRVHKGRLYLRRSWGKRDIPIKLPKNWNHIQLPDGKTYIGTPVEVKIKAIGRRRVENLILHVTFDLGSMQIPFVAMPGI